MLLKEVKDANEVRTFSCKSNGILVRHLEKHDAVTKPEHFFVKFMQLIFIFQRSKFIFLFVIFPVCVLSLRWKSKFMNFKLSLACRSRQRKLISEMLCEINLSERKIYISQIQCRLRCLRVRNFKIRIKILILFIFFGIIFIFLYCQLFQCFVTVCVRLFCDFITLYITVEIKFYSLWITTMIIASVFVYDVTVYSNSLSSRHVGGTNRRCFEVTFVN